MGVFRKYNIRICKYCVTFIFIIVTGITIASPALSCINTDPFSWPEDLEVVKILVDYINLIHNDDYDGAMSKLEDALLIAPNDPYLLNCKSDHYLRNGDIEKCEEYYVRALVNSETECPSGEHHLDIIRFVHFNYMQSIEIDVEKHTKQFLIELDKYLSEMPDNICLLHNKAQALMVAGELQKSFEIIERLSALDNNNPSILLSKVDLLWKLGRTDEAIDILYGLAYMDAGSYKYRLLSALREMDRLEEALTFLESLCDRDGDPYCEWDKRVDILVELGKTDDALALLDNVIAVDSSEWPKGKKAKLLVDLGRVEEAIEVWHGPKQD